MFFFGSWLLYIFARRYIFSLALADLLVIIICVPLTSLIYTLDSWPWGSALCRVTECAKDISIGVSVFTLTALSAERYYAIVNPLRKLQVRYVNAFLSYFILRFNNNSSHFIAKWKFILCWTFCESEQRNKKTKWEN